MVLRSYASRNQLAVTEEERQRTVELEWERQLLTVIGVANKRKYEFRLQADINADPSDLVKAVHKMLSLRLMHCRKLSSSWQIPSDVTKSALDELVKF